MEVLFINQGDSAGTSGQGRLESVLRAEVERSGLSGARFVTLAPLAGHALRAASGIYGPLWRRDLDFQSARWLAIQAFRARRLLGAELRRARPDVIHAHPHTAALAFGSARRLPPVVLSVDAEIWDWRRMGIWQAVRPWSRASLQSSLVLQRRALKSAALVMPWTRWSAAGVRRACAQARIVELHPGLDLQRFRPAKRTARIRPRVLFVGARFRQKGGYDMLAALGPELNSQRVEVDIVTPDTVPALAGVTVHRMGSGDTRLIELFQQADVLCLPSRGDAAPWVVLEAMACGVPVVASMIGAIPEFLDDGRAGALVAPSDTQALRRELTALIHDESRRIELGRLARRRVEANYDSSTNARRLLTIMRELQGGRESAPPRPRL